MAACEIAAPSDDILPPDQGGDGRVACEPAKSASFRAQLEPAPVGERAELACTVARRSGVAGSGALDLECGDAAIRLHVEADPAPTSDGFVVGQALKLTAIRAASATGGREDRWLRVETASGRLLAATAVAGQIEPPDASGWASPFAWREWPSTCMVEETGCGEFQRGALGLQLSGGAPEHLVDGTSAAVGDDGEYVAYVEAATVAPAGSECPPWFALGLLATR